jgi:hypothetical protein
VSDDIVAELDRWLAGEKPYDHYADRVMVRRARDEIVALRAIADLAVSGGFGAVVKQARAEQREWDARIAENACLVPPDGGLPTEEERLMCEYAAAAIRNQGDGT